MSLTISQEEYKALSRNSNRKGQTARKAVSDPTKCPDVATQGFTGPLKGAFILSLIGDGMHHRYIVHHPIGVTKLDADEWVISSQEEVDTLLDRKDDPYRQAREGFIQARMKASLSELTEIKVDKEEKLIYGNGQPRQPLVTAAQRKLKDAWNALYPPSNYEVKKGKKHPGKRPKPLADAYLVYMGDHYKQELQYRAFITEPTIREVASRRIPDTGYVTTKGSIFMAPQVAILGLKGLSKETVQRVLIARMIGTSKVGDGIPAIDENVENPEDFHKYVKDKANIVPISQLMGSDHTIEGLKALIKTRMEELKQQIAVFINENKHEAIRPDSKFFAAWGIEEVKVDK